MKYKILITAILFTLVACGGYKTSITQKESKGFLKFTGDIVGVSVSLNDEQPFNLDEETELYSLQPGKYNVKIYRGDSLILERVLIVDSSSTNSIEVP